MSDDQAGGGMYDLVAALESVIGAADPGLRRKLAEAIEAYANACPEDFYWAVGGQSPALLYSLMMAIDGACHPDAPSTPGRSIRLVDRKPEGSA